FVPAVAARFGPADVRVPRPRSAEEIALLRSIDVGAVRGGATPEQPMLSTLVDTDAWDRLGVDAIVTTPGRPVVGPVTRVRPATVERVDPAGRPFTTTVELVAGVRAVELDLDAPVGVTVQVDVAVDGRFVFGDAVVVTTSPVVVPVPGDGLGATDAIITVRIAVDPEVATLGLDGSGGPAIGIVGGGDGGSLVVADGVVIVHRPTPAVTDDGGADVVVESVDDRSLVLLVEAAAPTELVTDIVDRPGWTVTIDGSVGYRTAGPFVGAEVPSGEHRVEFSYRPPGLVSGGVVIAAAGAIWLLVGPVLVRRRSPAARAVAGSVPSRD
ncbi:MAG: YfhO family protein, partial [Actinomycetota bacterium]